MKFFEKHQFTIQGISNIVQALTVVILVVVTIFYAISTSSMAHTMRYELNTSQTPYLSIDKVDFEKVGEDLNLDIYLKNSSDIPVYVDRIETNYFLGKGSTLYESIVASELAANETRRYSARMIGYANESNPVLEVKTFYNNIRFPNQKLCHEDMALFKNDESVIMFSRGCRNWVNQ
jgi:hypothetical protein